MEFHHKKKTFMNRFLSANHLDRIDINDRPKYFRHATETEIFESIVQLDKEGGINYVSRKFLIMCEIHVSYYLKELFNFCIDSLVFPKVFIIAQIAPIHKKGSNRISVVDNLSKVFRKSFI